MFLIWLNKLVVFDLFVPFHFVSFCEFFAILCSPSHSLSHFFCYFLVSLTYLHFVIAVILKLIVCLIKTSRFYIFIVSHFCYYSMSWDTFQSKLSYFFFCFY